jgi:hypothetical protein
MLRWGDTETHHYIIGVFSTYKKAVKAGECEKTWRGGKYCYQVLAMKIDDDIKGEKLEYYEKCL